MRRILSIFITGLLFCSHIASTFASFSDVSATHPNVKAIEALQAQGVIQGYADGTFRPANLVNRAEALKILLLGSKVFVPELQPQEIFPDVLYDTWYAKYALKAKNLNIVSGDSGTGFFRPGDTINLAEALKILLKTNQIITASALAAPYTDVPQDAWFAPYFDYARKVKLFDVSSSQAVHPEMAVNRALLAELMYRLSLVPKGSETGIASYYGDSLEGHNTASGEPYHRDAFTAAHRTYPMGTLLKVTAIDSKKSVVVKVNDRGPYVDGRVIDLSGAAFEALAPLSRGIIHVTVEPLPPGDPAELCFKSVTSSSISTTAFDPITLDQGIPGKFVQGEVLMLTGTATGSQVTAFLKDSIGTQTPFSAPITGGKFEIPVTLKSSGVFSLGMIEGQSGQSAIYSITVLPVSCFASTEDASATAPATPSFAVNKGNFQISWKDENKPFYRLKIRQGTLEKTYYIHRNASFVPPYADFSDFKDGEVVVMLQSAEQEGDSLALTSGLTWSAASTRSVQVTRHEPFILQPNISVPSLSETFHSGSEYSFTFTPQIAVRSEGVIVKPDGMTENIALEHSKQKPVLDANGESIFPSGTTNLKLRFTPKTSKTHLVEINDSGGTALLNTAIYPEQVYPLLPHPFDLPSLTSTVTPDKTAFFNLINSDRGRYSLPALAPDTSLSKLAQARADDMAKRNYFGHYNPDGLSANDLRKDYSITQGVSENLALDSSAVNAELGLMQSAVHRSNILSKDWTRVGVGLAKDENGYLFVQIFSGDPLDLSNPSALRNQILGVMNETRSTSLTLSGTLNTLAQNWSQKMSDESFFDSVTSDGESLGENVQNAIGKTHNVQVLLVAHTTLNGVLDQVRKFDVFGQTQWRQAGIGIQMSSLQMINVTILLAD